MPTTKIRIRKRVKIKPTLTKRSRQQNNPTKTTNLTRNSNHRQNTIPHSLQHISRLINNQQINRKTTNKITSLTSRQRINPRTIQQNNPRQSRNLSITLHTTQLQQIQQTLNLLKQQRRLPLRSRQHHSNSTPMLTSKPHRLLSNNNRLPNLTTSPQSNITIITKNLLLPHIPLPLFHKKSLDSYPNQSYILYRFKPSLYYQHY